jgi:adenine-specific DNA-methyltransferase
MLEYIIEQTENYLATKSKSERKAIGQFFTSKDTAVFMADLFECEKKELLVLDTGAGTGILTAAFIEKISTFAVVEKVKVILYENNADILPLLKANMEYIERTAAIEIEYEIKEENYILSNSEKFRNGKKGEVDYIIGNPPYKKIPKDAEEALSMPSICYGTPNLYFLFAAMSLFLLKEHGEMVYIIPRSWTSGAYFERFRKYFLEHCRLTNIHLFVSRDKVFSSEDVLQETIIIKCVKTQEQLTTINLSSSKSNSDFKNATHLDVAYSVVVSEKSKHYVYLPTSQEDIEVLNKVNSFSETLPELGMKLKTGLTVGFRNRDMLRESYEENSIPLIKAQHFKNGKIQFPAVNVENQFLVTDKAGMKQKNKHYLLVKRFTAKEERRRLQPAVYFSEFQPSYELISTDNKINFIERIDKGELSREIIAGLYVIFNSTIYDKYYRILNGSTQVNATEINSIRIPSKASLVALGERLIARDVFSTNVCDILLNQLFDEIENVTV